MIFTNQTENSPASQLFGMYFAVATRTQTAAPMASLAIILADGTLIEALLSLHCHSKGSLAEETNVLCQLIIQS